MNTGDVPDKPNLLLVDDDVTFCQVLSAALERRGFAVHVAQADHDFADFAELWMQGRFAVAGQSDNIEVGVAKQRI